MCVILCFWNKTNLLWTIDDEVASRVQWAFVQLTEITICQAAQQTVRGTEHDGNFAYKRFLMLRLLLLFSILYDSLCDVHIQRGGIPASHSVHSDTLPALVKPVGVGLLKFTLKHATWECCSSALLKATIAYLMHKFIRSQNYQQDQNFDVVQNLLHDFCWLTVHSVSASK